MGIPDIDKLQDHLKTLFDGKIGKLAKEMAEEISEEFSDLIGKDGDDVQNPQDVIKNFKICIKPTWFSLIMYLFFIKSLKLSIKSTIFVWNQCDFN